VTLFGETATWGKTETAKIKVKIVVKIMFFIMAPLVIFDL
jgi:hypothetical protein